MGLKHQLKGMAREAFARVVWHTGLHRVFDALCERRMLVLYGHCVDQPATNGVLDADMKIDGARLRGFLSALRDRYELVTVAEGLAALDGEGKRSMVALTMDDGYRDNLHDLVPLLDEVGGRATVFLEGGAVADRELPWLHALGWLTRALPLSTLTGRLSERIPSAREAVASAGDGNRLKRVLKYDARPDERDRALRALLEQESANARWENDALYLSHEEARALFAADPIEVGGHTVHHPVLGRLSREEQVTEIAGGRERLSELFGDHGPTARSGQTFAYPYGRRWDVNDDSPSAVREAGYASAVTTHAGVNRRGTDRYRLRRWPIHNGTRMHLVGTEACGAFDVLRRLGIDLVE